LLSCIVYRMRAVSQIVVTVVVGWSVAVTLSGCAGVFGPSGVPSVAADPPSVSPVVPTKAVTVELCQNDLSATYERGTDRNLPAIGYIELTNNGTADCILVGTPLLAFSGGRTAPERAYPPDNVIIADGYHRGRTPVVVPPRGKTYVWTLIVDRRETGRECFPNPSMITAIHVQLPGASKWITAAANIEQCPYEIRFPVQVGPISSKPRYPTKEP